MKETSSATNSIRRSTRYLLRLIALWCLTFLAINIWIWFNVLVTQTANWLDAIFGLALILLLIRPSQPASSSALRTWPIRVAAWAWLAWMLGSGILWARLTAWPLTAWPIELVNLADRILYLPVQVFDTTNDLFRQLYLSHPTNFTTLLNRNLPLLSMPALLAAGALVTAFLSRTVWLSVKPLLIAILEELENRFWPIPVRPGRWLMWVHRFGMLLLVLLLLSIGIGSIGSTQHTAATQTDPISGPDKPPEVSALLVLNDRTLYAGTWGGGVYRSDNSGASWQPASAGLTSTDVQALALDARSGTLYAGTGSGGVFRSNNGGASWQAANAGLTNTNAAALAFDAGRGVLYVGTWGGGVYRSDDGGMSWRPTSSGLANTSIRALTLDADRGVLYVGTWGGGVYRSDDGGTSWRPTSSGLTNTYIRALALDASRGVIYVGTSGGGVYRSDDGGTLWRQASAGLTNTYLRTLTLDASRGVLYAGTARGVYRSGDDGASWQPANVGLTNTSVQTLALSASRDTLYAGTTGGVYRSENDGAFWQPTSAGLTDTDVRGLALDADRGRLYAGTWGGIYRSDDNGTSWQSVSTGLADTNVLFLALDASRGALYTGTYVGGVYRSDDGGASWRPANAGMTNTNIKALALDADRGTLYAGTTGGVYRSDDGGVSWQPANAGMTNINVQALAFDAGRGTLYAGTTGGVYRSDDGGASWRPIKAGMTNTNVQALAFDAGRDVLYTGTIGGVYRSDDGGVSWQPANAGMTNTNVLALALDAGLGTLYAGTWGGGGVYRSDDGGASWRPISAGMTNTNVRGLAFDAGRDVLYAGTAGGAYRSDDGGASWRSISMGLTDTGVQGVALDASHGILYAGTYSGVYRSDDGGASWQPASSGLVDTVLALTFDSSRGALYAGTTTGAYRSDNDGTSWQPAAGYVSLGDLLAHLVSRPDSFAFLDNSSSGTLIFAPHNGGLLALWLGQHFPVRQGYVQPQNDGSALLYVGWGNTISRTVLPRNYPRASLTWALIRIISYTSTRWIAANRTLVGLGFLVVLAAGLIRLFMTLILPLGIPPLATILARRHLNLYANPTKLDRAWLDWEAYVRSELLHHGDVTSTDLRGVPGPLRSYAIRRYAEIYIGTQSLDTRGGSLRLLVGDRLRRWKRDWRIISSAMGVQAGLSASACRAVDELATVLADTLGMTLGPARTFEATRAYQVEAPALRLKLPRRFPLVFLADPQPSLASVQLLFDTVEVIRDAGYFALVIPLEPSSPQLDVAARLREAVAQSPYAHDFVVLSRDDLEDTLIARHPVSVLARQITTQVDLTIVSPFVIRGPVPENMFFGRESEVRTLVERAPTHDFAVVGNRKIGKTSLLQRTRARFADGKRARILDVDCQTVSDAAGFLEALRANPSVTLTQATPSGFMTEMQRMRQAGPPVLLLLDEVDALLADEAAHGELLVSAWRSLAQSDVCHFVFCGASGLARRLRDPKSAFFNFAEPLPLRYLLPEEATLVIQQPMESLGIVLEDQEAVLEAMLALTSGHPNLVQYVGRELVKAANQRQERRVFATDVSTLYTSPEFVEYFLDTIWGEAGPLERLVMLLTPDESFQVGQIEAALAAAGVTMSSERLDDALGMLDTYSILRQVDRTYHLVPRAFRTILHRTQDVERRIGQEKRRLTGATA